MTQSELNKSFPHGVTVAKEGEAPNFNMVDLEIQDLDGKTAVLGWAYPNKDIWLIPEDVMVQEDGDWLFHSEGTLYRFSPLTAKQGKAEKSMMAEA